MNDRGGIRSLLGPTETRTFLLVAGWAFLLAAIYWFVAYEPVGTLLLVGLGAATAAVAVRLMASTRRSTPDAATGGPEGSEGTGEPDPGRPTADRPFLDEVRRLPSPSLAPFLVGLGIAVAATGFIFGLAPVAVGLLPILVGGLSWLRSVGAEVDATREEEDEEALGAGAVVARVPPLPTREPPLPQDPH
jgi:hypothetical protein